MNASDKCEGLDGAPACKDVESARRLIRQFKCEDGRHNSAREVNAQSSAYTVPEEGGREGYGRAERERLEREWVSCSQAFDHAGELVRRMNPPGGWLPNPAWTAAEGCPEVSSREVVELMRRARIVGLVARPTLGRFKDGFVREHLEDCAVGDAIPESFMEQWREFRERGYTGIGIGPTRFVPHIIPLTPDGGLTWRDTVLWERTH